MSDMPGLMVMLPITLLIGAGIGLALWLFAHLVLAVPEEDRSYLDQPPLGFRLVWWLIRLLAWYLRDMLPQRWSRQWEGQLQQAGLDYVLTAPQLVASQGVASALGVGGGIVLAKMLDMDSEVLPGALGILGLLYPWIWVRERIMARRKDLMKTLPFYLDIVTMCVEAGLNFNGALRQATLKGPSGVLREEFQRILRDIRAGKPRADALRSFAQRVHEPTVSTLVSTIIQSEALGVNLGPMLRAQADQRRLERFLRAEKLAMEAPVKMLFPLVAFIFPCTFVVLGFPILMMFRDIQ